MLTELLSQSKWFSVLMVVNVLLTFFGQDEIKVSPPAQQVQTAAAETASASPSPSPSKESAAAAMPSEQPATNNSSIYTAAQSATHTSVKEEIELKPATAAAMPLAHEQQLNFKYVPRLDSDLSKLKAVEVVATGYYAGKESTGKNPDHPEYGITFSGIKVKRDDKALSTIAADPSVFPLGTVLFIPGYGYGVVADIGSAIKGKKIDLYFDTKDQVYKEWGKKTVKVFIVKKGSGKVTDVIWNQLKDEILSPTKAL
ncbi:3D domain-containing protein [Paenibacillus hexagrammi]|uniref:3D domain-containing protein n=1 Tax=Paenibacillus hexagrammi TaxID=2908839 RepID=UPI002883264C|nr:3D domain-containing protein [Paenibacillus sp. YPD9-1]